MLVMDIVMTYSHIQSLDSKRAHITQCVSSSAEYIQLGWLRLLVSRPLCLTRCQLATGRLQPALTSNILYV